MLASSLLPLPLTLIWTRVEIHEQFTPPHPCFDTKVHPTSSLKTFAPDGWGPRGFFFERSAFQVTIDTHKFVPDTQPWYQHITNTIIVEGYNSNIG